MQDLKIEACTLRVHALAFLRYFECLESREISRLEKLDRAVAPTSAGLSSSMARDDLPLCRNEISRITKTLCSATDLPVTTQGVLATMRK